MKILDYLLGGRPMKEINKEGFWDNVEKRMVYFYADRFGREWMANNRWGWFRVKV